MTERRQNPDAICGNCGKPYKEHYFEDRIFCFTNTTGDIFTDEPNDDVIFTMITDDHPEMYDKYVLKWKALNGHLESDLKQ